MRSISPTLRIHPWKILAVLLCLLSVRPAMVLGADVQSAGRERLLLDRGWRFFQGDIPFPVVSGHGESYENAKAGNALGAAAVDFDDSDWRQVDLPHDWAIETPIDRKNNLAQGFHARGIGWYRRTFRLDPSDRGKHITLQFDGVATHCTVWVNGIVAYHNWCGYTGFEIDITPFAHYGDDTNIIAVRVDAIAQEGWWYEGAGIYRHTWLVKRNATYIATDGLFAEPVRDAKGAWSIPVEITLGSSAMAQQDVSVDATLIDPDGKPVAAGHAQAQVTPFGTTLVKLALHAASPHLWSVDNPVLYTVRADLKNGKTSIDSVSTKCGFRTIRFDANTGFYLNDQPLKLKGVCNHQDSAGIGVAVPDSIWDYRVRRLKEMGANAYRCVHNPPAAEFLDAADRLGLLVMDENRNFNTNVEYAGQLQWMVRRDRNHPSVILWSIFNEEPCQSTEQGYQMVRMLSALVKQLDTTRPVTAAQSSGALNPINASLAADVVGFNYNIGQYDKYHALHPNKPMISSEDTSAVMTRGEYVTDETKRHVIDSYDDQHQPWGDTHRDAWKQIESRPFMAGGFAWTGFDYRGEPQPLEWPATGSSFGIMDQCGFPKSAYWIHQAMWIKDKPILHLIPHWNWVGSEGKKIKVMGISNADEIELSLNGKVISRKVVKPYVFASWDVPYAAGRLEAVAFKAGKEVARYAEETTGVAVALKLIPDRDLMSGNREDAMPVTVEAVDAQGRVVPMANPFATFTVSGGAKIIGVANGDPICHEPDKAASRSLYNGLAQVILQSNGEPNDITLTATAEGLAPTTTTIKVQASAPRPFVAIPPAQQLVRQWRMSPATDTSPDPNQQIGKTDMNSWATIEAGKLQKLRGGRFVLLRTRVRPIAAVAKTGGKLVLNDFVGKAILYIDGQVAAKKDDAQEGSIHVDLTPSKGQRQITILVEAASDTPVGLGGTVIIEK